MKEVLEQELLPVLEQCVRVGRWKTYESYKDSGIEWLGEIPVCWNIYRPKFLSSVNPTKSTIQHLQKDTLVSFLPMELIGEDGQLSLTEQREIQQVQQGYTYFCDGDIIIAKITPCFENGKGALCKNLTNNIGFGTTELHVIRPNQNLYAPFLFYVTKSRHFRLLGIAYMTGAAGQQRVPEEFISNLPLPLPSLPVQQAIAAFLDRETAKINDLIAKKERLIELLQEQRTAIINQAVTRGLNPDVPMKDSGVEWLGEIPEHWEVRRLKHLTSFVTSGSRGWAQYYHDYGAIFLRIGNLTRSSITLDSRDIQYVLPPKGAEGQRTKVNQNDVLISITAYIGSVAVVTEDIGEAYVSQHMALVRPRLNLINPKWLGYCLISKVGQDQFQLSQYGGTKDGLGLDDVKNLSILVPPISEQEIIISYIERETAKIDQLISVIQEAIKKLKEYSTALVSAAVTGKIDVRGEIAAIDVSAKNAVY